MSDSTLIRSIIALSFLLNTVACGNSGANGIGSYDKETQKELDKADEVLKQLDKERASIRRIAEEYENENKKK